MQIDRNILPPLILLTDFGGDYHSYIDAVYDCFHRDFITHKAQFGSHLLRLKFNPLFQDRAYTFYHMTHSGEDENERTPDLRRCERMPWARFSIEQTEVLGLKFWEQERHGKHRVCIWLEVDANDNYFVILDVRDKYVLLWTAFWTDDAYYCRKKEREYQMWKQSITDTLSPDGLIADIQSRT